MKRQSIRFTEPNDEWLSKQVAGKEYASKSELINDLVRHARRQQSEVDWIRLRIEKAEQRGFTSATKEEILKRSKDLGNA